MVGEKNVSEKKTPTHVDVHITHDIKSPKNVEFIFIQSLGVSNMLPYTKYLSHSISC